MLTSFYPVITTADVPGTAAFYSRHFGFKPRFSSDWYVHLEHPERDWANLAILDHRHSSIPEGFGKVTAGVLINFEVEDVDAEHARLRKEGVRVVLPLRDEAFGQRHFIMVDPNGLLIDVIQPIPPSAEFADQYTQG